MYCSINFQTKKELRDAVAAGEKVMVFQPGGLFEAPTNGRVSLEGPHYPKPHRWYASATLRDGIVVEVK